jgi:hypothetical protein
MTSLLANHTAIISNFSSNIDIKHECRTSFRTVTIYNWILFAFGLVGNILTIVILNRARTRKSTVNLTITSLAVADMFTLLFKCLQTHLKYVQSVHYSCFLLEFFTHVAVLTAIWIIVWMTIERCVAVCFPLKIHDLPTRLILSITIACTICTFSIMNVHFLFAYESKEAQPWSCFLKKSYYDNTYITFYYFWIKSLFYSWLPILILTATNLVIIYSIRQAAYKRKELTTSANDKPLIGTNTSFKSTERQMTIMLVSVSVTFIILTLPYSIYQLYFRITYKQAKHSCFEKDLNRIVIALADLNHAINFILYCITGKKFRNELKVYIDPCRKVFSINPSFTASRSDKSKQRQLDNQRPMNESSATGDSSRELCDGKRNFHKNPTVNSFL